MCFLDKPTSLGLVSLVGPQKTLVERTYWSLSTLRFLMATANCLSASPFPYTSAVSKKLIPKSQAYLTNLTIFSWLFLSSEFNQFPKATLETLSPVLPRFL